MIVIKINGREREIFHHWSTPQWAAMARAAQVKTKSLELPSVSPARLARAQHTGHLLLLSWMQYEKDVPEAEQPGL